MILFAGEIVTVGAISENSRDHLRVHLKEDPNCWNWSLDCFEPIDNFYCNSLI